MIYSPNQKVNFALMAPIVGTHRFSRHINQKEQINTPQIINRGYQENNISKTVVKAPTCKNEPTARIRTTIQEKTPPSDGFRIISNKEKRRTICLMDEKF